MYTPKISIIVPVYNVENYLTQCLDSILNQTFKDWECILVDDGSTDASPAICDDFASKDSRFKVIHKINGGLSRARNVALAKASADLIGFIDSDDWVEPEMFKTLYELINEYDADIAQIGFIKEYVGRRSTKTITNRIKAISGEEAIRLFGFDKMPNYVWNKLHRRHIITCDFPEGRTFEDLYVYSHWIKNIKKMVLSPAPLYHYRMRKGSIIHSNASKNRYDSFIAHQNQIQLLKSIPGIADDVKINAYINKCAVNAAKIIARRERDTALCEQTIRKISDEVKGYPLPSARRMGSKTWLRAYLLRSRPETFISLMRGVHMLDLDGKDREKRYFD